MDILAQIKHVRQRNIIKLSGVAIDTFMERFTASAPVTGPPAGEFIANSAASSTVTTTYIPANLTKEIAAAMADEIIAFLRALNDPQKMDPDNKRSLSP